LTLAAAAAAVTIDASAGFNGFANFGDIKGESIDDKHKNEIDVLSWSWGVTGPQRKTPVCPHEFSIDKYVDAASPLLVAAAAQGKVFPSASLSVRKAGSTAGDFLIFTFTNAVITSIDSKGMTTLDRINETMTLAYASATISYKIQLDDGSFGPPITATVAASCPPS
jgi:type VI secretion system secreted protein Hcp